MRPVTPVRAGMIQAQAFMMNKARLDPLMVQLPSALHTSYTTNITLSWSGTPESRPVAFDLVHAPAVSMTLQDGWYGTTALKREYLSANVYFDRDTLVLDTSKAKSVTFKVRGLTSAGVRVWGSQSVHLSLVGQLGSTFAPCTKNGLLQHGQQIAAVSCVAISLASGVEHLPVQPGGAKPRNECAMHGALLNGWIAEHIHWDDPAFPEGRGGWDPSIRARGVYHTVGKLSTNG